MFGAFIATVLIATSSATQISNVSVSASGGSSAEASSYVRMGGGTSTVEVRTVVDGVEHYERRESAGGEPVELTVVASSTQNSSTTLSAGTSTELRKTVSKRILSLVRNILSFFGLSIGDL